MSKGSRLAARLAAVQALYQQEMEATPLAKLLHEFHAHRLGAKIADITYREADTVFFDDIVQGVDARRAEIDAFIADTIATSGWTLDRLDRPMRQVLRAGGYELLARPEIATRSVISNYLDVADAFYDERERGFANGVLDAMAKAIRG